MLTKKRQRGNTILEFALVCAFLVPLFAATADTGMLLTKSIQVTSVSRDSVVLLLRATTNPLLGLDLSLANNQGAPCTHGRRVGHEQVRDHYARSEW